MSGNPGRRASPILPWSAGSRPTTRWSALGAVLAVAGVTACADNESSLYFRHAAEKQMEFLKLFDAASVTECYQRKDRKL